MKWIRIAGLVFAVAAGVAAIDRLLFDFALFAIPNPSGWDSFRWMNFEYHFRRAEKNAREDKRPLVLFVGSSVAQYSYSKEKMEALLGPDFRVDLISHAALIPTDMLHYKARILAMKPAVVVWPVNPVDFDLERLTPPWEAAPLRFRQMETSYLFRRVPAKMYYPGSAAGYASRLSDKSSLLLREVLYSLRYPREEWLPFTQFAFAWDSSTTLRSYLNYQGMPVGGGLFREGYTGRCFSFPASYVPHGKLQLETPVELARAGLVLTIGEERDGPCPQAGSKFKASRAGWGSIPLPPGKERYAVSLSHVSIRGKAAAAENLPNYAGRGVRLPGNLGRVEMPVDEMYVRRPVLEEERLRSLSERELIEDYETRLQPDNWKQRIELSSLNRLRLAKTLTLWSGFVMNRQLADLREFVQSASAQTHVLIVNQAEHPLALDDYAFGSWYEGYRSFLSELPSSRAMVLDVHDRFTMEELGDPHHLTLAGALRLQPMIYEALRPILERQ